MSHFERGSMVAKNLTSVRILDAEIAILKAQREAHINIITPLITETGRQTVEGQKPFTVSENNTYDEAVILASLKPGQVRRVSILKVDKPTVKRLYLPVYNSAKVNHGLKFTI